MKTYHVHASFPGLPSAHADVEASNIGTALRLALTGGTEYGDPILKRPDYKRRRITEARITVRLVETGQAAPLDDASAVEAPAPPPAAEGVSE